MAKENYNRIPLYLQIREYILNQIRDSTWKPEDQIPSESELANQFRVSRITIRGAISKLIEDGIIFRIQGKGTFIASNVDFIPAAYNFKEDNNKMIAYLMPRLDNFITANLLSGVESEISKHGYSLLFRKTQDSKEIETQTLQEMVELGVKGIIVYPVAGEHYNEEILKLTLNHFPLVVVDRYLRGIETNCVCADNIEGARQSVAHLIELGHHKIGFISSNLQPTTSMDDRWIGYERALIEHGIPVENRLQLLQMDMKRVNSIFKDGKADEECKNKLITFLKANSDITALFAANSAIGLSIMEAVRELGILIPNDLSVISFDDYEASTFSAIPPTCISQQEFELGTEAGKLLISILNNPKQERQKIITPVKLIVRSSTGKCKVMNNR
jgi:GntR family transcriptional regulator of arabinose operon